MNSKINPEVIKEYMRSEKMSTKDFCKRVNMSRQTFYNVMSNRDDYKVSLETVYKISKVIGCSIDYLIGESEYYNANDLVDRLDKEIRKLNGLL